MVHNFLHNHGIRERPPGGASHAVCVKCTSSKYDGRPSRSVCLLYLDLRRVLASVLQIGIYIGLWKWFIVLQPEFKKLWSDLCRLRVSVVWCPVSLPKQQEVVDIVGSLCAAWQASIKKQKREPWLTWKKKDKEQIINHFCWFSINKAWNSSIPRSIKMLWRLWCQRPRLKLTL